MSKTVKLTPPLSDQDVLDLEIGDKVLVTGVIYTARDAAHKRLIDLLTAGKPLPMEIKGQIIYYVGPKYMIVRPKFMSTERSRMAGWFHQ